MTSFSSYIKKGHFYKPVVEDGSDIIFIVTFEGEILYCNKSVRELGYKEAQLIGNNFFNFINPEILPAFRIEFKKSTKKKFNESVEFQFRCKNKDYKFFEFNSINLKHQNNLNGLILDCRDISQRKKDAEELLRAQKAKELFLANISHEIRTPINGIAGMADLLNQNPSAEDQALYLKAIKTATENLKVIINDILDLASIESGKLKFEKINFNIDETIHSLVNTFRLQAHEKGIKLEYHLDRIMPSFFIGDPVRLNQILINLISNALKFTHQGSIHISVSLQEIKDKNYFIKFEISDTGIGIPKTKLKTIFESFSQADASVTRKYGGTGLGLTIVRQLVQLQHGRIEVSSEENQGSTFTVTIPYKIGTTDLKINKAKSSSKNNFHFEKASILLVEDNDINRLYASSILKMWGCSFETAENGEVALEKLKNLDFDVVLMDVQMPVMDGFEATKAIRKWNNEKGKIPIIALTANITQKDVKKCLEVGMNGYLSKPFTQEDLQKTLDKYILNKTSHQSTEHAEEKIEEQSSINFSYLEKVSGNNKDFVREIVDAFLKSIPQSMVDLEKFTQQENWFEVARVVHKIKPSLILLGATTLKNKILKLEEEAKLNKNPYLINKLSVEVGTALKETLNTLQLRISSYS